MSLLIHTLKHLMFVSAGSNFIYKVILLILQEGVSWNIEVQPSSDRVCTGNKQ